MVTSSASKSPTTCTGAKNLKSVVSVVGEKSNLLPVSIKSVPYTPLLRFKCSL